MSPIENVKRFDYQTPSQRLVVRLNCALLVVIAMLAVFVVVFAPGWAKLVALPFVGLGLAVFWLIRTEFQRLGASIALYSDRVQADLGNGTIKSVRYSEISDIQPVWSRGGIIGMQIKCPDGEWIEIGHRISDYDDLIAEIRRRSGPGK